MNTHTAQSLKYTSMFIFAGEQSGDLHGSHLIKALKSKIPEMRILGENWGSFHERTGHGLDLEHGKFRSNGFH